MTMAHGPPGAACAMLMLRRWAASTTERLRSAARRLVVDLLTRYLPLCGTVIVTDDCVVWPAASVAPIVTV